MNNKQLKAYIRDKYGLKVKDVKYGYILLREEGFGSDSWWCLYTNKVFIKVSEIIDYLNETEKKNK